MGLRWTVDGRLASFRLVAGVRIVSPLGTEVDKDLLQNRVTRAHLQDVMARIDDILEGNGG